METNGTTNGAVAEIEAPRERGLADLANDLDYARAQAEKAERDERQIGYRVKDWRGVANRNAMDFKLAAIHQFTNPHLAASADAAIATLRDHLADEADLKAQLRALTQQAEEAKAMVQLNAGIDGKNAEVRSAQLVIALRDDPGYQAVQKEIATVEAEIAAASNGVRVAQAQLDLAKSQMRQGTACLELLGS